jgi:hypothetical protein
MDVAFTMKQYVQTDLKADRQVANTLAELILGGLLASVGITGAICDTGEARSDDRRVMVDNSEDPAA